MIEQADDEGRRLWSADEFRSIIYSYQPKVKEEHILKAAQEVLDKKLAYIYKIGEQTYYQMHDWHDHHRIDHPTPSIIPPPTEQTEFVTILDNSRVLAKTPPNRINRIEENKERNNGTSLIPLSLLRSNQTKELLDHWFGLYQARMGQKPRVEGKRDMECCKAILAGRTIEEAKAIVDFHFNHPEKFYAEKALYGIHHIRGAMNQIIARMANPTNMALPALNARTKGNLEVLERLRNRRNDTQ